MSPAVRLTLLALAATAALSGCKRREAEAPPAPAPAAAPATMTPADAAAPMAYDSKNQFAEVKLALPEAIKTQPDLHARVYAEAVRDLRQFVEGAQADQTEAGGESGQPYTQSIDITAAAETGKLISLRRATEEYTGGAHGNTRYGAVLWDKALKRQLGAGDLFRAGADAVALNRALCEAVNVARKARGSTEVITLGGTNGWACPEAIKLPFVLAAGTTPGKAGGLTFLIDPYLVDAYAAGPYEITLPQSAFRALLNPAYADEFAGAPQKAGDVTPRY